jgi:hypothetical protein
MTHRGGVRDDLVDREGLEQADRSMPTRAGGNQRIDGLLDRAVGGAHHDDDAVRVGSAVVVHQPVLPARPLGELIHDLLDDAGDGDVERVGRFTRLEEDIRVLRGATHDRGVRGQATGAEGEDILVADEPAGPRRGGPRSADLVRRPKPSKKWRNGTRARRVAA